MSQINSTQSIRQVSKKKFDDNWERTFGKKKKDKKEALEKLTELTEEYGGYEDDGTDNNRDG